MKQKILLLAASLFALVGYSQTNDTPYKWIDTPLFYMQQTNVFITTYGIYDTTSKQWGGGVGVGYLIPQVAGMIAPIIRFDYINDGVWVPQVNLQFQAPIDLFNKSVRLTPLTFAGLATSFNNFSNNDNGSPVGIFGIGAAIKFGENSKWGFVADYERWTGGPFNDNQIRGGLYLRF